MGKRRKAEKRIEGGCIWGVMGLLDFRGVLNPHRNHGHALGNERSSFQERLLSNCHAEKDGPVDYEGDDGSRTSKSIRILIDEEISYVEKLVKMSCTDSNQGDFKHLNITSSDTVCDRSDCGNGVSRGESGRSQSKDLAETFTDNLDLAAMLHEIINNSHEQQKTHTVSENSVDLSIATKSKLQDLEVHRDRNQCILQQTLNEVLEVFLRDKILSIKGMSFEVEPQKLLNMWELLNSDRNLALKLLQGTDSNPLQHIQDLQNAHSKKLLTPESCRLLEDIKLLGSESCGLKRCKETVHRKPFVEEEARSSDWQFTSRAESSYTASTSNSSTRSTRSLTAYRKNERAFFLYSFREIKSMLRNLLGPRKNRQKFVPIRVLPKNWYGFNLKDVRERMPNNRMDAHLATGFSHDIKLATNEEPIETVGTSKEHIGAIEAEFQKEAKRHLAEVLKCKAEIIHPQERRDIQTLKELFTMQEQDSSSRHSSDKDKEPASSPMQMRLTFIDQQIDLHHCYLLGHAEENPPCTASNSDDWQQRLDARNNCHDANDIHGFMSLNSVDVESNSNDFMKRDANDIHGFKNLNSADVESNSNGIIDIMEIHEDETHQSSAQDSPTINLDLHIPWSYNTDALEINRSDSPDILIEKTDRPSPVSIFEQTFLDGIRYKECITSEETDHEKLSNELHFEEDIQRLEERSKLSYLRSLLEASGILHCEAWFSRRRRRHLDTALFHEVEPPTCGTPIDHMLYFDRINEALDGIHASCFQIKPWVGFVDPKIRPLPQGEDLVQELWRKAGSCGVSGDMRTLDEIVGGDLREERSWVEIGEGVDEFGVVVGDDILEEILEEVVSVIVSFC